MSKYLTKFETETAFSTATDNLARPHVSLTVDNNQVHYLVVEHVVDPVVD